MKQILLIAGLFLLVRAEGQDTAAVAEKKPVEIFSSDKAINANTTETSGRGIMSFKVAHNFGDIAGNNGGIRNFFGLDATQDVRIGFHVGLSDNFDLILARAKGGAVAQLWELGFKWTFVEQQENGNPLAIGVFANAVVSTMKRNPAPNTESSFTKFGERVSHVFQLILARRMGDVSIQLNPTYITRGLEFPWDQSCYFALGGAVRIPIVKNRFNFVADYFHPFRSDRVKDSFLVRQNVKFYDPLGIGFEFLTGGHEFRLNFMNNSQILENRFIPRTVNSWGKGSFRWCFTIVRNFTLWRKK